MYVNGARAVFLRNHKAIDHFHQHHVRCKSLGLILNV